MNGRAREGSPAMRPAPGLSIEQQTEAVLKRIVLWGEARGEPVFTKLCILWVIKNRMTRKGTHWRDEILRPKAFSCFNHDDPNLPKLLIGFKLEPEAWVECEAVVDLFDWTKDPTGGANHYYDLRMNPPPAWGRGHALWKEKLIAGDLVFGDCP